LKDLWTFTWGKPRLLRKVMLSADSMLASIRDRG
jgi:hypothetical protein